VVVVVLLLLVPPPYRTRKLPLSVLLLL